MAAVNPNEPSQPSQDIAYNTAGNPASKEPAEKATSQAQANSNAPHVDQRIPSKQTTTIDEATPTSMARGVRGKGASEDTSQLTDQEQGKSADVNAEQMAGYGEGRVAEAVDKQSGAGGGEPGLETDLDRKKAEQAPAREKMKQEEKKEVDVGGVLGQRGGPANPVDKEGYPNKSA
ncbi:uncharacterized protein LTR77_001457 [Saxophila tyrrhenica]|uniref:Uncharacterized protein n=1 Tax=Saxophila tyrrhenica TaxID=1690608 RepID=A0AAV9PM55_9PEZI|nr:hypothetical protein LTR77_001457 [Saxophila tyrrhenica]